MINRRVVWDTEAINSFKEAYLWIKSDSVVSATKFRNYFLSSVQKLVDHPEFYHPDKYRLDKDLKFRAFEKFNYRVTYFNGDNEIRILRFRHVKQKPLYH